MEVEPYPTVKVSPLVTITVRGNKLSVTGARLLGDSAWVQSVRAEGPLSPEPSDALELSFSKTSDRGDGNWHRRRGKF